MKFTALALALSFGLVSSMAFAQTATPATPATPAKPAQTQAKAKVDCAKAENKAKDGSFDPVTNGHLDVIRNAFGLADRLVVAIGVHSSKAPLFQAEERAEMVEPDGRIHVTCEYCATIYQLTPEEAGEA